MKEFGSLKPAVRESFKIRYLDDDDQPQAFVGQVAARSDGAAFIALMRSMSGDGMKTGEALADLLARMMDDKDGVVKAKWQPVEEKPPADLDDDELAEWVPHYRGPDGLLYALPTAEERLQFEGKWEDESEWTTRRRWNAFMNSDEGGVALEELMNLAEWIMGLVAERPTRPRG